MPTIKFPLETIATTKIDNLVKISEQVIYKITTVFPFDLYPDKIVATREKIDISYAFFFKSEKIFPVIISNIQSVKVQHNMFFATLELEVLGFKEKPPIVKLLKVHEAMKMRRVIMGLVISQKEKIDISQISFKDLVAKLEQIGIMHDK